MQTFGQKLKNLRTSFAISQKDMATYLDITPNAYQKYEYDTREPNFKILIKIAAYFDVPTDYLLGTGLFENWDLVIRHKQEIITSLRKAIKLSDDLPLESMPENRLMFFLAGFIRRVTFDESQNEISIYYLI